MVNNSGNNQMGDYDRDADATLMEHFVQAPTTVDVIFVKHFQVRAPFINQDFHWSLRWQKRFLFGVELYKYLLFYIVFAKNNTHQYFCSVLNFFA